VIKKSSAGKYIAMGAAAVALVGTGAYLNKKFAKKNESVGNVAASPLQMSNVSIATAQKSSTMSLPEIKKVLG